MKLIHYFLIGFNMKFIRNVFYQNNLIVTFYLAGISSISSPPIPFILFEQLQLHRIVGCFFSSDFQVNGFIFLNIVISDSVMVV